MNHQTIPDAIQRRYDTAWLRGPRVSRLEERRLGYFRLDAETAWELGKSNVGVFVGTCPTLGGTIERLQQLEQSTLAPRWLLVAATKKMAAVIIQRWFRERQVARLATTTLRLPKVHRNIVLATPESLRRIGDNECREIAAIIAVDMLCQIHQARSGIQHGNFFAANDRPQLIANYRNALAHDNWLPPFVLLTQKAAKSVPTDSVARAYCLDAWWFVDGASLRCGRPPPLQSECVNDGSDTYPGERVDSPTADQHGSI